MKKKFMDEKKIEAYRMYLVQEEKSAATIGKYLRDIRAFARWLEGREITKEGTIGWKQYLRESNYAPASVNSMLSSLNGFLKYIGREDCRVKFLRIQRSVFRDPGRDLTHAEYRRLIESARSGGRETIALVMETICATGIRVSELRYVTVESLRRDRAEIALKGKVRTILFPRKLRKKLLRYAESRCVASGEVFRSGNGKRLSRSHIWEEMKKLCAGARVEPEKVFPHNLRHLFALTFYRSCRDIVKLADILGHSSLQTTRIYLTTTGEEHARELDRLGLVY